MSFPRSLSSFGPLATAVISVSTIVGVALVIAGTAKRGFSAEERVRRGPPANIDLRREEQRAFDYLNQVRSEPSAFSREIGVDLTKVKPRPPLRWSDVLATSAQRRADDMALRNYFGHVDPNGLGPNEIARRMGYVFPNWWPAAAGANNIESIEAGLAGGVEAVRSLLQDNGARTAGHRMHLLGMTDFYASHQEIGIGFSFSPQSDYKYYLVIHTGRH